MIVIRRSSGHPLEQWSFDEQWLWSANPLRERLLYEGSELRDFDDWPFYRGWSFDGQHVHDLIGNSTPWDFENGILRRTGRPSETQWTFDGRVLCQVADQPDCWQADADVPLLVIMFTAGLL